jgi:hypothetical protein
MRSGRGSASRSPDTRGARGLSDVAASVVPCDHPGDMRSRRPGPTDPNTQQFGCASCPLGRRSSRPPVRLILDVTRRHHRPKPLAGPRQRRRPAVTQQPLPTPIVLPQPHGHPATHGAGAPAPGRCRPRDQGSAPGSPPPLLLQRHHVVVERGWGIGRVGGARLSSVGAGSSMRWVWRGRTSRTRGSTWVR